MTYRTLLKGSQFRELSSREAPQNCSRTDTQLHRQLTPYPAEVIQSFTLRV